MSKGGGKQTSTQTQSVDPEFKERALQTYARAEDVANRAYTPYTGQMVAGFTPQQEAAFAQFGRAAEAAQPAIMQAQDFARRAGSYQPQTVAQAMEAYRNPYEEAVVSTTLGDIERARQVAQTQGAAQAVAAKAFGGSRQGVAEAETNRAALDQAARTAAQLRSAGYESAANLGARDIAAAQQAEAQRLAAAGQLGQLGAAQQAALTQGAQGMFGAGGAQQQLAQARLEEAYKQFAEEQAYPLQQLQIMQQALGFFPNPMTTTGVQRQTLGPMDVISRLGGAAGSAYTGFRLI